MLAENQTCSLELSKKLLAFGVKQNSLFYWIRMNFTDPNIDAFGFTYFIDIWKDKSDFKEIYSAFTVSEIMDLLPAFIDTKSNEPFNIFGFNLIKRSSRNIQYICNYHCECSQVDSGSPYFALTLIKHNVYDEKLADCLAKTLIYLYENGFIKNGT